MTIKGVNQSPPGEAWQERRVVLAILPSGPIGPRLPKGAGRFGLVTEDVPMNEIARQLRAQIPSSTDPQRLERMAREAERQAAQRQRQTHGKQGPSARMGDDVDTIV